MKKFINSIRFYYHKWRKDINLEKTESYMTIITLDPKTDKFNYYAAKTLYHTNMCIKLKN